MKDGAPTAVEPAKTDTSRSLFRVRQPIAFGRYEFWPAEYQTLGDAMGAVSRVGNTAVEIVNCRGEVVEHSVLWWRKRTEGKNGRP